MAQTRARRLLTNWLRSRASAWRLGRRGALARRLLAGPGDLHYGRVFSQLLEQRPPALATAGPREPGSVLLACGSLGPGGTERQVVLTARGLAARGRGPLTVACVFLDSSVNSFFRPMLEHEPVELLQLPTPAAGATAAVSPYDALLSRLPSELADIGRFARLFHERRPEVVHCWLDEINVKAGLAAVLTGVPRIVLGSRSVSPAHFALFQPYMREGYRALIGEPNVVLLNNSEAGAADYESWLVCAPGTCRVVRNGFDASLLAVVERDAARIRVRHRLGMRPDGHLVGAVLRLSEEKQPLLVVETAAELSRLGSDAHVALVGDGALRQAAEERAAALGLTERLHFTGRQPHVLEWMASFDVLLLTSRKEGLPNVLLEAQALGVPVVTTPAGGAVEALEPGRTGWIADPQPRELAETVARVLADDRWRASARIAGPAFVEARFGLARMLDETLAVYDDRIFRTT